MLTQRWIVLAMAVAGTLTATPPSARAASTHSVTLEWTAPGDDGLIGTATSYDIRYSRDPINTANFLNATRLNSYLLPGPAGTPQRFTLFGLTQGIQYFFAIRTCDDAGNWSPISNVVAYSVGTLSTSDGSRGEAHFSTPWPNPARGSTRFTLSLPQPQWVRIEAFDLAGRKVRTLALGEYSGGTFDLAWNLQDDDGRLLGAGTYLVRGQIGENVFLRRVTVVH